MEAVRTKGVQIERGMTGEQQLRHDLGRDGCEENPVAEMPRGHIQPTDRRLAEDRQSIGRAGPESRPRVKEATRRQGSTHALQPAENSVDTVERERFLKPSELNRRADEEPSIAALDDIGAL